MTYPRNEKGTRLCMVVAKSGIKVYGNRQAFKTLSKWMSWIADSDEREHYECHFLWHLKSEESEFGEEPANIWTLFDRDTLSIFDPSFDQELNFDLTFMAVEQSDLDKLAKFRASRLLPENWEKEEATKG
ncbi:MAG: hypothetical protein ACMUJM_12985 [bacterium]